LVLYPGLEQSSVAVLKVAGPRLTSALRLLGGITGDGLRDIRRFTIGDAAPNVTDTIPENPSIPAGCHHVTDRDLLLWTRKAYGRRDRGMERRYGGDAGYGAPSL
jgi:hypothetical protein